MTKGIRLIVFASLAFLLTAIYWFFNGTVYSVKMKEAIVRRACSADTRHGESTLFPGLGVPVPKNL